MRIISAGLVCFLLVFSVFTMSTFAHNEQPFPEVSDGKVNEALTRLVPIRYLPSNPLYFLISAKEIFSRVFQPSSLKRAEFDFILSGKRLKETYSLFEKNDNVMANKNLRRYGKRLERMNEQLEKARAQNQDVVKLSGAIADGLNNQEIILAAISQKWHGVDDIELDFATASFVNSAYELNAISPGLKDRFRTVVNIELLENKVEASPSPSPFSATPSARPRRIIY